MLLLNLLFIELKTKTTEKFKAKQELQTTASLTYGMREAKLFLKTCLPAKYV